MRGFLWFGIMDLCGGAGYQHLFAEQGSLVIHHLLGHILQSKNVDQAILICFNKIHLCIGLGSSIFTTQPITIRTE